MKGVYVFDFYNLYLPYGKSYVNKQEGIRIRPLKIAEDFEKHRRRLSSPYRYGGWKTAKCYISASSEKDAIELAQWLELLYSVAQSRSVFYLHWYKHNWGSKRASFASKFVEVTENRSPDFIYGTHVKGARYKRDISLFIDTALTKFHSAHASERDEILITIHAHCVSNSQMPWELKFLTAWLSLERLANKHYVKYKSKNALFDRREIKKIRDVISSALDGVLVGDRRLNGLKNSISRNFLYEYTTSEKVKQYLALSDLGFDKKNLTALVGDLVAIRGELAHNLNSRKLQTKPYFLFYLRKIMEKVILRQLNVSKDLEQKFLLSQYNRGNLL